MPKKSEAPEPPDRDTPRTGVGFDRAVGEWKRGNFAQLTAYLKERGWDTHVKILSVIVLALGIFALSTGAFDLEKNT